MIAENHHLPAWNSIEGKDRQTTVHIPEGIDLNDLVAPEPTNAHRKPGAILDEILDRIEQVNFRELASLDDDGDKLKNKHYLVCTIEHILNMAQENQWGICKNADFVYLFNGCFWNVLEVDELKDFLGKASEKMGVEKFDARYYVFRDQLYKQFLATAFLAKPERSNDVVLINLENGTFEITPYRSTLREFRQEDFLTYQLPFSYDATAAAPKFQSYLQRVLPDVDSQNVLAEYIAYVFAKNMKLEKCLLLFGSGANGKSVFFDVVNALLGSENVSNFSLANLDEEHNRALIQNVLLNYGSEINARIDKDIFKNLVSGEPVQARLKYGNTFTMKDYARLCFNCNELPREVEHNEAWFRRFLPIPFTVTIPEEERDNELAKKIIKDELPGVFNWVLDGLNRLLSQRKFSECSAAAERFPIL